jgi:hypothetical protein
VSNLVNTFLDFRSVDFMLRARTVLFLKIVALKKQRSLYEKGLQFDSFFLDLLLCIIKSTLVGFLKIERKLLFSFRYHLLTYLKNIVRVELIIKEKISNRVRRRLFSKLRRIRRKIRRRFSLSLIAGRRKDAFPFSFLFRVYMLLRLKALR